VKKCGLSERHPEKQGLKLHEVLGEFLVVPAFRASSRKTRIETSPSCGWSNVCAKLSERHPEKQGLKLRVCLYRMPKSVCFQSVIQKNKD